MTHAQTSSSLKYVKHEAANRPIPSFNSLLLLFFKNSIKFNQIKIHSMEYLLPTI